MRTTANSICPDGENVCFRRKGVVRSNCDLSCPCEHSNCAYDRPQRVAIHGGLLLLHVSLLLRAERKIIQPSQVFDIAENIRRNRHTFLFPIAVRNFCRKITDRLSRDLPIKKTKKQKKKKKGASKSVTKAY
ncbi:hypothetical protein PUN28_015113 [Cardiocondyla obscurior]|uniref:Uncharacterized protein n=1 Tax=Cardiocondyla obscurior TaxID=286306 RepID=A0AAW2F2G1_9HYME